MSQGMRQQSPRPRTPSPKPGTQSSKADTPTSTSSSPASKSGGPSKSGSPPSKPPPDQRGRTKTPSPQQGRKEREMALSCGAKCAKAVLIIFNLIFWLSGCALIAFGIFMLIEVEKSLLFALFKADRDYTELQYLALAFIGIGGLVFIVGFFGCCGAMQENKCMLIVYLVFLIVILGCELAVGVLAIIFQDKTQAEMQKNLKDTLQKKYSVDQQLTKSIDLAQTKFMCCGMVDASDYKDSVWKRNQTNVRNVAPTCCVMKNPDSHTYEHPNPVNETMCQREDSSNLNYRHQKGCMDKLKEFLQNESKLFTAIGIGIAALELFGIIFSICLCKEI